MLTSLAIVQELLHFSLLDVFRVAKGRMSSAEGLPRSSHHSEGEPSRLQTSFRNWIEPPRLYQRMALVQGGRES